MTIGKKPSSHDKGKKNRKDEKSYYFYKRDWCLIEAKMCALMTHIRYDLCTKGHSNHPT